MITPTRFGLKYAPVPTLALEYEDDLTGVDDDGGGTSLYVYANATRPTALPPRTKKLHVVELPALTRESEAVAVARELQRANRRFLAPDVVNERQLVRLLEHLMAHLQAAELLVTATATTTSSTIVVATSVTATDTTSIAANATDVPSGGESDDDDLDASAMSESLAESLVDGDDASDADDHDDEAADSTDVQRVLPVERLATTSAAASSSDAEDASDKDDDDNDDAVERQREAAADAAKRAELRRNESPTAAASDNDDDDVQSEELEYFSDDASGSDDSF